MKKLRAELYELHNFDLLGSNMISVNRTLPDPRSSECVQRVYPKRLPKASVIIVFHNEPWSTLIRTIWSIVNRSPKELLQEIILVDDASTDKRLQNELSEYVKTISRPIKIIRSRKREGLIRARLIGTKNAAGSVMVFLDAHMECAEGWLEPLLARIASDRSVVAVPVVDGISSDDMSYTVHKPSINGFRWGLIFNW